MNSVLLSIITVNYNNSPGLKKTIESVVSQTYAHLQYIIIDGGSTDRSIEILKEHSDKIYYWISEKDKGIYNAMNKGIVKATGEYCLFLNSGDWLVSSDVIERLFSTPTHEAIIYGNVLKVSGSGKDFVRDKSLARSGLSLLDIYYNTLPHQSTFIKRSLFDKYGLYDENFKVVSDWVFFLKSIGVDGVSVKYLDHDISYYDINGFSSQNNDLRFKEKEEARKQVIPKQLYKDYLYLDQLHRNKFKISFYDKLNEHKMMMLLVKVINRVFRLHLWKFS